MTLGNNTMRQARAGSSSSSQPRRSAVWRVAPETRYSATESPVLTSTTPDMKPTKLLISNRFNSR